MVLIKTKKVEARVLAELLADVSEIVPYPNCVSQERGAQQTNQTEADPTKKRESPGEARQTWIPGLRNEHRCCV